MIVRDGEDRRDLVGLCVIAILIPSDDEQTVVRRRLRQIGTDDVRLQPGIPLRDRAGAGAGGGQTIHVLQCSGHVERAFAAVWGVLSPMTAWLKPE